MSKKFLATIGYVDTTKKVGMTFEPHVRRLFVDYINDHVGEMLEIIPRKKKKTVSDNLRGYYFGAIIPFIKNIDEQFAKYTPDEVHEILKHEFNGFSIMNPISKKIINIPQGAMNDSCNTQDAFIYIEKIRRWVAENYGEELPDPIQYKALRDRHFETEPIEKIEYPTEEVEDPEF